MLLAGAQLIRKVKAERRLQLFGFARPAGVTIVVVMRSVVAGVIRVIARVGALPTPAANLSSERKWVGFSYGLS